MNIMSKKPLDSKQLRKCLKREILIILELRKLYEKLHYETNVEVDMELGRLKDFSWYLNLDFLTGCVMDQDESVFLDILDDCSKTIDFYENELLPTTQSIMQGTDSPFDDTYYDAVNVRDFIMTNYDRIFVFR